MENNCEKEKVAALLKRLEAEFGDVDLDMEMLGLNDDEECTNGLEEMKGIQENENLNALGKTSGKNADSEAAALMSRLGSQFGDLDMTNLGSALGLDTVSETEAIKSLQVEELREAQRNSEKVLEEDSEDSSLEDPTPEELEAWQASQFNKGREKLKDESERKKALGLIDSKTSTKERRKMLRDKRESEMIKAQAQIRIEQQSRGSVEKWIESSASSALNVLGNDSSVFFSSSNSNTLDQLVSNDIEGDPEILQTTWKRLYASYEQGLGFWNLWNALMGYDGPTVMILRALPSASKRTEVSSSPSSSSNIQQTACIGFYTTTPWTEGTDFFGGDIHSEDLDRAFLFSINEGHQSPTSDDNCRRSSVNFFPAQVKGDSNGGYMYCRPSTISKSNSGRVPAHKSFAVNGIGVGGKPTQPRFHLTESFENCRCLTYDSSRITKDGDLFCFMNEEDHSPHPFARTLYYFDVEEIEVWGVGGDEWIEYALKERENTRKQRIRRYQVVDKKMMWDQGAFGKSMSSSTTSQS